MDPRNLVRQTGWTWEQFVAHGKACVEGSRQSLQDWCTRNGKVVVESLAIVRRTWPDIDARVVSINTALAMGRLAELNPAWAARPWREVYEHLSPKGAPKMPEMEELVPVESSEEVIGINQVAITIRQDSDWGLHEADPGYMVYVKPVGGLIASYSEVFRPILTAEAGQLTSLDVVEGCEEGDPHALAICRRAENRLRREYKKVGLRLSKEAIGEIARRYPERDGDFATKWEGWRKK